jgi:RimJ/RimL family protein N-acetyltransferase
VRVEPLRRDWIEALVVGDAVFAERFGIPVVDGWAGFPESLPYALDAARREPARQGRGLATAATRILVERAREAGVTEVVAHTLATPNASTAVLTRCGFTNVATTTDPDAGVDGDVWRWELALGD